MQGYFLENLARLRGKNLKFNFNMNENEIKRLEELKKKDPESLTKDEATEKATLCEKESMQKGLRIALQTFFQDSGMLKAINNLPKEKTREEKSLENPAYALSYKIVGVKRRDSQMIKAADPVLVSDNDDGGGYLVPAITQNKILELIPTYAQARQYMTVMPVGGNVIHIPKEGTLPTWTWGISENTSITSSKPTFGAYTMTPSKGAALVVLSNEMLVDPNVSVGDYIVKKIAQAKGTGEDSQFFNGSGSPFTGVFASGNTFGNIVTTTGVPSTLTYANLISAVYGVDPNYLTGAKWFFHRSHMATIQGMLDDQGRPIFQPANQSSPFPTLLGYPVVLVENAPTTATSSAKPFMILGNLESSIIGDISGMTFKLLEEATIDGTSLAQYDLSAIRVVARASFTSGYTNRYSIIRQAI